MQANAACAHAGPHPCADAKGSRAATDDVWEVEKDVASTVVSVRSDEAEALSNI